MGWGEVRSAAYLLNKDEGLGLNAQEAHEGPGMAACTFGPTAGEADTGGFPGVIDLVTN